MFWAEREKVLQQARQLQQFGEQCESANAWLQSKQAFLNNTDLGVSGVAGGREREWGGGRTREWWADEGVSGVVGGRGGDGREWGGMGVGGGDGRMRA